MNVTKFEIELLVDGKEVKAKCEKFKVGKHPQIRVSFGKPSNAIAITFYEVKEPERKYFWFELPDNRERIARKIAKALESNEQR
jgi:hypothetical protein